MQTGTTRPRPVKGDGGYEDVFTAWRRYYAYLKRAGVTSKIKRDYRRRERRQGKRESRNLD